MNLPCLHIVPHITLLLIVFSIGIGSPVIMLSSIKTLSVKLFTITPSTGTLRPASTSIKSPFTSVVIGTSERLSSYRTHAVLGAISIKPLMADEALFFARSSRTRPTREKERIITEAS